MRRISKTIIFVLSVSLLVGCSTIPAPSDEVSCLLIIDREFERKSQWEPFLMYNLYLDDSPEPHTRFSASDYPLVIEDLEPGEHEITKITWDRGKGKNETVAMGRNNIPIHLEPGSAYVSDITVVVKLVPHETNTNMYTQETRVIEITQERRDLLIENLKGSSNGALWDIQF